MIKEYSFSVDLTAKGSGIVKASSLEEAVEKVMSYEEIDITDVEYDLPYGFGKNLDEKEKAYYLGIMEEKND